MRGSLDRPASVHDSPKVVRGGIGLAKKILVLAVIALATLAWLGLRKPAVTEVVVSGVVEAEEIRVGSRVGGRVAEVLVAKGEQVEAGAVLVRIEPHDLLERVALAAAELEAKRSDLARLTSGFRSEEIAQARARRDRLAAALALLEAGARDSEVEIARENVATAEASQALARSEHDRVTRLAEQGSATASEVDRVVQQLQVMESTARAARLARDQLIEGARAEDIAAARAALAEAEAALSLFEAGYRAEEIARARAEVAGAEAELLARNRQVAELEIRAPIPCVVEVIELHKGDLIAPGAPSIALLDHSRLWLRSFVPQAHLSRLKIGMELEVRIDGQSSTIKGRIRSIARQAEFTPTNVQTPEERSKQVFRVEIDLPASENLRPGMMADVLIGKETNR